MADSSLTMHIFTLGSPEVRLGNNLVTFPTRKTLALMIYLAVEGDPQSREHLGALFWPESNSERSHGSLRNTLRRLQAALRQAAGQASVNFLSITRGTLGINQEIQIDFDLHKVEKAYMIARAHRASRALPEESASLPLLNSAAASMRGDFLAGFSLSDAPAFDDWSVLQREIWRRRMGLIFDRLSEIQFAQGEFSAATDAAARWVALDTLNEVAYRQKMRAHFAAGERGQALETYETCRAKLAAEIGVEPAPDTIALAERIRTQTPSGTAHPGKTVVQSPRPDTPANFLGNLFAGRVSEHEILVQCFEQASSGLPKLVVIQGEAGIGKTRLAREFLAWAGNQGAELLQCSAFESGSHLPFQPLVEGLRLWFENENFPKDVLEELFLSPLSQMLPDLRERYPGLGPDPKAVLHLETDLSQTQIFEPFTQLTISLAQRTPLIIFMDDLQWTDSATLDLLEYAIRRWKDSTAKSTITRIILMVSLRPESLHPMIYPPTGLIQWLAHVGRELTPVNLELAALGEHEMLQMMSSILAPPTTDFAQWLYDETRGHPFYMIETLKDLLERHVLHPKRQAKGNWVFSIDVEHDLGQAVRVPSTVHAVVRSRLNRLSPNAFSMLAGGAVLEQRLSFKHLCATSNVAEDLALAALDELISSRLLLETVQPGTRSEYTFTNEMLRDVVYTEAGDARRRLFHQRALELLEAEGDSAAVLAHHAMAAGLVKAAFTHSLAAGRQALRISAVNEAIIHLERAYRFVHEGSLPEKPGEVEVRDLFKQLSRAYELSGQTEKALTLYVERERFQLD